MIDTLCWIIFNCKNCCGIYLCLLVVTYVWATFIYAFFIIIRPMSKLSNLEMHYCGNFAWPYRELQWSMQSLWISYYLKCRQSLRAEYKLNLEVKYFKIGLLSYTTTEPQPRQELKDKLHSIKFTFEIFKTSPTAGRNI